MPTQPYYTADGKRVPGTTTVIGRFKESGGLIHWAWQCGVDGVDYRQKRDAAGDAGTVGHELIDAHIHEREPLLEPGLTQETLLLGRGAYDSYLEWEKINQVEFVATEMPMVSEDYRFGGTPDAVGWVGPAEHKHFALLDWKTGGRVYPEFLIQVAAYTLLWHEIGIEGEVTVPIERIHLLRVGKEDGSFHHHSWPVPGLVMDAALRQFKRFREAYDDDKILKKAA